MIVNQARGWNRVDIFFFSSLQHIRHCEPPPLLLGGEAISPQSETP